MESTSWPIQAPLMILVQSSSIRTNRRNTKRASSQLYGRIFRKEGSFSFQMANPCVYRQGLSASLYQLVS